ncbi:FAD-binding oxidoreductase [Chitinophaga sp. sic0106]|uniref:NAD(P)/FAD-dependent oxidoreductase n=1 Tax=Chitinophaga sp. sic0106 TaxID=2854785 RepID=UPI001C4794F5|nr:FAD-binding oxidoreductase [Chitinophaga sp. sic0106]MBV7532702.1 FAD-binding oxidoreductase [Chitinophaga sp. sic0106]
MKQVDYIIVGQGIAGTMLSWFLMKRGFSVVVIDDGKKNSASRVAAGIINPVSGRRFEPAWLYEEIYPFAKSTYDELSDLLKINILTERNLWTVFPSAQMRDAFKAKADKETNGKYAVIPQQLQYEEYLQQDFGAAVIKGATVNLKNLLPAYREMLISKEALLDEHFELSQLQLVNNVQVTYHDIAAKKIIFCDGAAAATNPYFSAIKFLPNKGEVLFIRVPGLESSDIIKKSITLVPQPDGQFWAGSSFAWDYADELPTAAQRVVLEEKLQQLLKVPYEVTDQQAAVRPSGHDRRPIAGFHPEYPLIGIFNGLGTKGTSLAPLMADHFSRVIAGETEIMPEISVNRYFNMLRQ